MGQNKSKVVEFEQDPSAEGGSGKKLGRGNSTASLSADKFNSAERKKAKKKWRRKQGYSLPNGLDKPFGGSTLTLTREDPDDAVLVSYNEHKRDSEMDLSLIHI